MKHELVRESKTLRVLFAHDILSTNAESLRTELMSIVDAPSLAPTSWDCLEADLSGARMVDSVGLNFIAGIVKVLQKRGKRLRVRTASPHIRRAFKFTRLDQLAEVVGA